MVAGTLLRPVERAGQEPRRKHRRRPLVATGAAACRARAGRAYAGLDQGEAAAVTKGTAISGGTEPRAEIGRAGFVRDRAELAAGVGLAGETTDRKCLKSAPRKPAPNIGDLQTMRKKHILPRIAPTLREGEWYL